MSYITFLIIAIILTAINVYNEKSFKVIIPSMLTILITLSIVKIPVSYVIDNHTTLNTEKQIVYNEIVEAVEVENDKHITPIYVTVLSMRTTTLKTSYTSSVTFKADDELINTDDYKINEKDLYKENIEVGKKYEIIIYEHVNKNNKVVKHTLTINEVK